MPAALFLSLFCQIQGPGSQCMILPAELRIDSSPIHLGWHDELNASKSWQPLGPENQAKVSMPKRGAMVLTLGTVPVAWPYSYQWSGVQRDATVDIAKHPYLSANVSELRGYAHMDIDVLDASGNVFKSVRSSTLQVAGVCFVNFKEVLDPATYRLRIRLIVGGPNEGCNATYNWVRFTSIADGERLQQAPDF